MILAQNLFFLEIFIAFFKIIGKNGYNADGG
jgi:hypothetical protein